MSASWRPQEPTIHEPAPLAPCTGLIAGAVLSALLWTGVVASIVVGPVLVSHTPRAVLEGFGIAAAGLFMVALLAAFRAGEPKEERHD